MESNPLKLGPDLYRRNAFRILGLSTVSSFKTVTRREQSLNTAIEMQDNDAIKQLVIGSFMGLPDEPTVRSSSNRLGDPHQRLIDELFWLPPRNDDDDIGQRLRQSRPEGVVDLLTEWEIAEESAEEDIANRATHSLAVFHHMLAIEIEAQIDEELRGDQNPAKLQALKKIAEYSWNAALPRWRAILASEQTWKWLHDRAVAIDKRRLKPADVEAVQRGAEAALAGIMVEFMVRAANKQRTAEIERVRSIVQKSGFSGELLDTVVRGAVGPAIEDLDSQVAAFATRLGTDKTGIKQRTLQLLDELEPKITAFRMLLDKNDPKLTALEDSFASAANNGQIAHWNQEKDDEFSFEVLKRIKTYVHSPQLLSKIDLDIESTLCFFCKERVRKQSSSYDVSMWRISDVQPRTGNYSLGTQTIKVSRCEHCARSNQSRGIDQHREVKKESAVGWRMGLRPSQDEVRAAFMRARF